MPKIYRRPEILKNEPEETSTDNINEREENNINKHEPTLFETGYLKKAEPRIKRLLAIDKGARGENLLGFFKKKQMESSISPHQIIQGGHLLHNRKTNIVDGDSGGVDHEKKENEEMLGEEILKKRRMKILKKNEKNPFMVEFLKNREVSHYIDETLKWLRRKNIPEVQYRDFKSQRDQTLLSMAKVRSSQV